MKALIALPGGFHFPEVSWVRLSTYSKCALYLNPGCFPNNEINSINECKDLTNTLGCWFHLKIFNSIGLLQLGISITKTSSMVQIIESINQDE